MSSFIARNIFSLKKEKDDEKDHILSPKLFVNTVKAAFDTVSTAVWSASTQSSKLLC